VWRFTTLPLLPDDRSNDLVFHNLQQDASGTIRIASSKGFFLLDPRRDTIRHVQLHDKGIPLELTGLYRIGPDRWVVGTETGLLRYAPGQEQILTPDQATTWSSYNTGTMVQTRAVWSAAIAERELVLVGALGYGHLALDPATGALIPKWSDYQDQANTTMLRSTQCDGEGWCWSATAGGVVRWRPVVPDEQLDGTVYNMHSPEPYRLPGNDAQALAMDEGTIWVALRDAGLARINAGQAQGYIPPAHMPHDALGVAVDRSGKVWSTTSNGLLRFDPATNGWLHVPVNDGREFRQLSKCLITLHDGRVAFCADGHLLIFDPTFFDALPELPSPVIAAMRNTWGPLRSGADGALELAYRNSAFDVMLTALQPTGAAPLTFLCRLDGEDRAQHGTDARAPLRYAGVPVGSHSLLVRVRDAYGREGPEVSMLTVNVIGPFWQQWWFFLLVLATGALGMYLVARFQRAQRAKLQGVRDRIARDLHDDIGSTLGSISFYSEALRRHLSGTNDGTSQEVAEKIGSSSREMIDRMSDIVWSVDPKNDDAGALIERLQAFAKDLLSAKNIALDFRADQGLNERKLSAEQRRNLFLICKEVLYNTVKYSDAGKVSITFVGGGQGLSITIADDGRGFDPMNTDSYNGNGLVNMLARAEAINAVFNVMSSPSQGTQVKLHLPTQQLVPRSGD
jgi:two-component sensor histidine kinase